MKKIIGIVFSLFLLIGIVICSTFVCAAEDTAHAVSVSFVQDYAQVGKAFEVKLEGEDITSYSISWFVDGKSVGEGVSYTPTTDDLEKMITVKLSDKGGNAVCSKTILCSKLPVIYIDTEGKAPIVSKEDYLDATLSIQGNEKYNSENSVLYNGATQIKGRGNSTWLRFPKKPYRLKLDKKADLFGMGKNKHWALLANYIDDSLMRNSLAGDIAQQLGVLKMDSVPVELVLNGEHLGSYILVEHVRVDSGRVDVFNWEDVAGDAAQAIAEKYELDSDAEDELTEHMEKNMSWMTTKTVKFNGFSFKLNDYLKEKLPEFDGGFLVEMDEQMDEVSSFYSKNKTPLMVKAPEYVKTDETAYSYIQNYMNTMEDAFYSDDHTIVQNDKTVSYTDIVDFDSLVSYWLTSEMLVNEAGAKSTYVHKELGEKLTFGPIWDFDYSSGGVSPWGSQPAEKWVVTNRKWFKGVTKDPYFIVKARELFLENESYFTSLVSENSTLDSWYDYLRQSGVKNFEIWDFARGFEEDFSALKLWLTKRVAFFQKSLATDKKAVESFWVTLGGCDVKIDAACVLEENDGLYYVNADTVDKLTVNISNADAAAYNYYVNSKFIGSGNLVDKNAEFVIGKELLTEEAGKKNVIVIRLKNEEGDFIAVQMATVTVVPADSSFAVLTLTDGEKSTHVKVLAGERVYLDTSSECGSENCFAGWKKDSNIYPVGTSLTVEADTVLTASYKLCNDLTATHSFKTNENYDYSCSVCQITKPTDVKYKDVASLSFEISTRYNNKYTGKAVLPKLTVTDGSTTLKQGVHYTLTAQDNVNTGFAFYTLKGLRSGGYDGTTNIAFEIIPRTISSAKGGVDASETYYYTGSAIAPRLKLTYGGKTLNEGTDYTITEITDNVNAGTARITVKGIGGFKSSKTISFKILPSPVKDAQITLGKTSYTYNGTYCKPGVKVKVSDGKTFSTSDYSVAYTNNLNAGTATVTVTFKGNYSGKLTKTFKIVSSAVKDAQVTLGKTSYTYNGTYCKPTVKVKASDGKTFSTSDYSVAYTNNLNAGTATVTVTFKGNYSGKLTKTFKILPVAAEKISVSVKNADYNGKVHTPAVTVKDKSGKKLKKDTDYVLKYSSGRKNIGKYSVTVTFKGNYNGSKKLYFNIVLKAMGDVTASRTTSTITLKWDKVTGADGYRVYKYNSKTKKYEKLKDVTGTSLKISKLKSGTVYKYKIRAYKKGESTIWGGYSKVLEIATKPATPKITKLTTTKGKASLTWSNVSGETGYQVYYSTKKDGGFKKVDSYKANVIKASKSKLTSKKTYYFKVRAYKKTDGGTVYSAWSPIKSVKIK